MNIVAHVEAVDEVGIAKRSTITWASLVDVVLENGCPDHRKTAEPEPSHNSIDGWECDSPLSQEWVYESIDKR